ncbi:flagellar assembly protein T N-terminal domain-containing protein [Sphingosinicella soli]|uniref:Flagellar assembly protein T N-terminal domain-containing protein n=1 Tax=Sphingosinicella soli TaxID=333708 RepID=A0A7W7B2U2_9SPHN|nr:flagellar assembly protein T N-terminal domain-containing protein [Sphingosinicella soli]MBB4632834.1 hypothetical protein [Sphingosinicella soli]
MRHAAALLSLVALLAVFPASADTRVAVEGAAPLGADAARARRAAIGDALRQAVAAGGMDVEARTIIDRNIVRSDTLWATARAKVTAFEVTDEWRENGLLRVAVSATLAPLDANVCNAARPAMHVGALRVDIDPAIDPAIAEPVRADAERTFRAAYGEAAAPPLAAAQRSSDRYAAIAHGGAPGYGLFVQPFIEIRAHRVEGAGLVSGKRAEAVLGVEVFDAVRGTLLGRITRDSDWTLSARSWEYLPADYRPSRRAAAPDFGRKFADLVEDAGAFARCRPLEVAVNGASGDELLISAARGDLVVGDLLGLGDTRVAAGAGPGWTFAEVVSVSGSAARARVLGDGVPPGTRTATRLR